MPPITDSEGRNVDFIIDDFEYQSIATADFSPSEDPSLSATEISRYCDKGFYVMPHADGNFYGITWRAYKANGEAVSTTLGGKADLTPDLYKGTDATWIPCRFVKVYANDDGSYASAATTINVGIAL